MRGAGRAVPARHGGASTTGADAAVDTVVLPLNGTVERRRTRRLRNPRPWDGLAGRRQIIPIEKTPRRRLAELRGDVPAVVLGVGRNARHQRRKDDDDKRQSYHSILLFNDNRRDRVTFQSAR